jgi:hypothetical protein
MHPPWPETDIRDGDTVCEGELSKAEHVELRKTSTMTVRGRGSDDEVIFPNEGSSAGKR